MRTILARDLASAIERMLEEDARFATLYDGRSVFLNADTVTGVENHIKNLFWGEELKKIGAPKEGFQMYAIAYTSSANAAKAYAQAASFGYGSYIIRAHRPDDFVDIVVTLNKVTENGKEYLQETSWSP